MPPSGWRSIRESCLDREAFLIAQATFHSGHFKSKISNQGLLRCGLIFRRYVQLPEIGIRSRKRDASLNGPAVLRSQEDDAAVLLLLRQLISEQQLLSLVYRDAQQQQGAIGIHI